jgi:two-component system, OmpR family, sensor histidine kinase QseC
MRAWRSSSLHWRLTLSLLLVTGLVWVLVLVMTWLKTEHELNELLDAHLAQTAAVLAVQTSDAHDDDFTTTAVLHKYQPRVAFQIWHENELIARSSDAPMVPLVPLGQSGISDQRQAHQSWRVFATPGRESDVWVMVAELQSARNDILNAGLHSAIVPMLLALPVLALLIWGAIFQSLAPLRQLSLSVSQRHPDARQPLSEAVSAEVQPLVRALNGLFEQMALRMEGERRFTADAAHELRTPIAAIRMQAQVALGTQQDRERQSALNAVLQGCDRATRLVAQLLQLARLDADAVAQGDVACDAVAETRATLADLGPQASAKHQTLSLEAPQALPLAMPHGLVGVLVGNLVDNAQRYSPAGARIHVAWQASPVPRLVVQDSGPGLAEADVARLGDRFFRVPGSGADGSGLGWSIVRRLAQRYRLQVQLERSAELGGLRVVLTWPVS